MIVFDLHCVDGHRFEGWFGSSTDFADQFDRGLVSCPHCGSDQVSKAPMAPNVAAKSNARSLSSPIQEATDPIKSGTRSSTDKSPVASGTLPPEVATAMKKLAQAQAKALKESKWVGGDFAEKSRAMHYGEEDSESIHGEATLEEAKELLDEGISVAPLPFPVAKPDDLN